MTTLTTLTTLRDTYRTHRGYIHPNKTGIYTELHRFLPYDYPILTGTTGIGSFRLNVCNRYL